MNVVSAVGSDNVTVTMTKKELGEVLKLAEPAYETLLEVVQLKGPCRRMERGEEECAGCRRVRTTLETFSKFHSLSMSVTTDELVAQLLKLSGRETVS